MEMIAIAGIVIVAILLVLIVRSRGTKPASHSRHNATVASKAEKAESTKWRAVEIRPGLMCCASVGNIANQVYLAQEAPALPLADCTEKKCQCKYRFRKDRRSDEDRRSLVTHLRGVYDQTGDRRSVTGRRAEDLEH